MNESVEVEQEPLVSTDNESHVIEEALEDVQSKVHITEDNDEDVPLSKLVQENVKDDIPEISDSLYLYYEPHIQLKSDTSQITPPSTLDNLKGSLSRYSKVALDESTVLLPKNPSKFEKIVQKMKSATQLRPLKTPFKSETGSSNRSLPRKFEGAKSIQSFKTIETQVNRIKTLFKTKFGKKEKHIFTLADFPPPVQVVDDSGRRERRLKDVAGNLSKRPSRQSLYDDFSDFEKLYRDLCVEDKSLVEISKIWI